MDRWIYGWMGGENMGGWVLKKSLVLDGWIDGWMGGKNMGGWVVKKSLVLDGWMGGSKSRFRDCLQQSKMYLKRPSLTFGFWSKSSLVLNSQICVWNLNWLAFILWHNSDFGRSDWGRSDSGHSLYTVYNFDFYTNLFEFASSQKMKYYSKMHKI